MPQYCTPVLDCLHARLGQRFCGVGMGVFEPFICPAGHYCPKGNEQKICPSGYFCPSGTKTPIQCSIGGTCPEGSIKNTTYLPIACLVLLDLALLLAIFVTWLSDLRKRKAKGAGMGKKPTFFSKAIGAMPSARSNTAYKVIDDEDSWSSI